VAAAGASSLAGSGRIMQCSLFIRFSSAGDQLSRELHQTCLTNCMWRLLGQRLLLGRCCLLLSASKIDPQ